MSFFATLRQPSSVCALLGLGMALFVASTSPVLSGCGSALNATPDGQLASVDAPAGTRGSGARDAPSSPGARVASALRAATRRWRGTPYRLGGTTPRGVDCSGFVQRLFTDVLDVDLSRSTRTQVRQGQRVARSDLRPGDLVFFRPSRKVRHVGVYVGDGEFAHASTSAGPTVTPLARTYWQDAYWTARRVLRLGPEEAGDERPTPPAGRSAERAGW